MDIIKKIPYKFMGTILGYVILLLILSVNSRVPIFSTGFLFDVLFIIGFVSFFYLTIKNELAKNIVFTVIGAIFTTLLVIDHIYYKNFLKFSSITSLNNLGLVTDNMDQYGIKLDGISALMIIVYAILVVFLFIIKKENGNLKQRLYYLIPTLFLFMPFIFTYIMAYNDVTKLGIIIYRPSYSFPEFVKNFGYIVYRYEDIACVIDSIGGNL